MSLEGLTGRLTDTSRVAWQTITRDHLQPACVIPDKLEPVIFRRALTADTALTEDYTWRDWPINDPSSTWPSYTTNSRGALARISAIANFYNGGAAAAGVHARLAISLSTDANWENMWGLISKMPVSGHDAIPLFTTIQLTANTTFTFSAQYRCDNASTFTMMGDNAEFGQMSVFFVEILGNATLNPT